MKYGRECGVYVKEMQKERENSEGLDVGILILG
jgi:hypothetical protein